MLEEKINKERCSSTLKKQLQKTIKAGCSDCQQSRDCRAVRNSLPQVHKCHSWWRAWIVPRSVWEEWQGTPNRFNKWTGKSSRELCAHCSMYLHPVIKQNYWVNVERILLNETQCISSESFLCMHHSCEDGRLLHKYTMIKKHRLRTYINTELKVIGETASLQQKNIRCFVTTGDQRS